MMWRYLGLFLQFAIVVAVARTTDIATAGQYFAILGVISVAHLTSGLGVPDAIVKMAPINSDPRSVTRNGLVKTSVVNMLIVAVALAGMVAAQVAVDVAAIVSIWIFSYAQVFAFSQGLLASGYRSIAMFGMYSSINVSYLCTLIPHLLVGPEPTVLGMLTSATLGASIAAAVMACVAAILLRPKRRLAQAEISTTRVVRVRTASLILTGFPIAAARVLQSAIPWAPLWFLAWSGEPGAAAVYAAASRLAVAATAVLGSIRFAFRPAIVTLAAQQKWTEIAQMSRRASYISSGGAFVGIVAVALVGDSLIPAVFGDSYDGTQVILIVLLFGIVAEAVGGLSDEILKMTGKVWVVLVTLFAAVGLQLMLVSTRSDLGAVIAAWSVVAAFATQYLLQVFWLYRYGSVSIWPVPWSGKAKGMRL